MKLKTLIISTTCLILFISCKDDITQTPQESDGGTLYGVVRLVDEYSELEQNHGGTTVQIYDSGKPDLVQEAQTNDSGYFSFNNIKAGVYHFKWFKSTYLGTKYVMDTLRQSRYSVASDTAEHGQVFQFVGKGRLNIDMWNLHSKKSIDSSYWIIKPLVHSIEPVETLKKQFIRDGFKLDTHRDTIYLYKEINAIVTSYKIHLNVLFNKTLPNSSWRRYIRLYTPIYIENKEVQLNGNLLSYEWTLPTSITTLRDSSNTYYDNLGVPTTLKQNYSTYFYVEGNVPVQSYRINGFKSGKAVTDTLKVNFQVP